MVDKKNKDNVEFDAQKYYSNSYSSSGYSIDDFFKNDNTSEEPVEEKESKKGISININFDFLGKLFAKKDKSNTEDDYESDENKSKKKITGDIKIKIVIAILLLCIFCVGLYVILSGGKNVIKIS